LLLSPVPSAAHCDWLGQVICRGLLFLWIVGLESACGGGGGASNEPSCTFSGKAPAVLVWEAVPDALGYRIYYRTAPGSYIQNLEQGLDVGNVTTYSMTGLAVGTTYHFAVTAYGTNGESDFSNEACKIIS